MWSKRPWTSGIAMILTKTKGADSSFDGTWAVVVTAQPKNTTKPTAHNFFMLLLGEALNNFDASILENAASQLLA
jgi:hypothetical protein